MKCALVGAGAVGIFYGVRLAQGGAEVHFLLRSGWEEARTHGLRVLDDTGLEVLQHPLCARSADQIGAVDWVIIALKTTENHAWSKLLPPLLAPGTRLLTLQNGLGQEEALAQTFPGHPVYGGLCFVCLNRISPATVRHLGHGSLVLGALEATLPTAEEPPPGKALHALATCWQRSGIAAEVTTDLREARWRKLIWNIPFNGLAIVLGGVTVDRILADPEAAARCRRLMEETRLIAQKLGCAIEPAFLQVQIERTKVMGAYHPSSLLDYQAGRAIELDAIWEEPLRQAQSLGLDTPELARLVEELRQKTAAAAPSSSSA